jgi:hypothetical protein
LAHLNFTRRNIELTILQNQIEENLDLLDAARVLGALDVRSRQIEWISRNAKREREIGNWVVSRRLGERPRRLRQLGECLSHSELLT